jgi:glyoxylase-like metal-dependent hydrolase (beta-lactamase superfamily II)
MNANALRLARAGLLAGPIILLASCATSPQQDAGAVLARAAQATGAAQVNTLRYTAEGTGYTFGQAYKPGGAWPKITLHSVTRSIDYGSGTMREETVLSRAEPLGGGGYPLAGQQRNEGFVSGELAWNVAGGNPTPAPRAVGDRMHQLWITPHGAIKAAMRSGAATARPGEGGASVVSLEVAGRLTAAATIGADGLPSRIDSVYPDPVLGDTAVTTSYDDWRDAGGGVKFPMRIRQSMGGYPVLDLAVKEVQVNPPLAMPVPDAARNTAERVASEKVAEGVWFLAGGSHNSVLIELKDQLVLVETPLNDARTQAVIDRAKGLVPGKPIRTAINTHPHFDHAGGVRTAAAEGATIVTHADNVAYYERVFAQANRIRPDAMARAGKKPLFRAVGDKLVIGDAARPIELHRTAGGPHSDSLLMVYLPKEKLLIEADSFTPPPPNTPPPAVANANNVNLVENIERLQLAVDRILPLHGRVVPVAELYGAMGRTAR